MIKTIFGQTGQVQFESPEEYYRMLGFLAKSDGSTKLVWEHNEDQGAWGSEGRIQINTHHVPTVKQFKQTAGVGNNIVSRVNCNEYVEHIVSHHGFVHGSTQDIDAIRATVPNEYKTCFNEGLAF